MSLPIFLSFFSFFSFSTLYHCVCIFIPFFFLANTACLLICDSDKVQGLCYASHTRQLISCSADGGIVIWNMDVTRQEVKVTTIYVQCASYSLVAMWFLFAHLCLDSGVA